MKAFWISALLLVTCASALTGISKSLVVTAPSQADRLAVVRSTSDPYVLAASLRRSFVGMDNAQPGRAQFPASSR